jgi:hypothetical protein
MPRTVKETPLAKAPLEKSLLGSGDINSKSQAVDQAPRRGGRASRQKGDRLERAIVRLLQDHGLSAERVPLSGSAGGSYRGDLTVPLLGRALVIEAKARKDGFRELYAWLEAREVIVRADRKAPLCILPLSLAIEFAAAAERAKDLP